MSFSASNVVSRFRLWGSAALTINLTPSVVVLNNIFLCNMFQNITRAVSNFPIVQFLFYPFQIILSTFHFIYFHFLVDFQARWIGRGPAGSCDLIQCSTLLSKLEKLLWQKKNSISLKTISKLKYVKGLSMEYQGLNNFLSKILYLVILLNVNLRNIYFHPTEIYNIYCNFYFQFGISHYL